MKTTRGYIAVDPNICHGQPHFSGTRVLVHTVLELLEAGISTEEITGPEYYPGLTEKHISAAFR
ncbi:MAG TPA: antitoxin [Candidatus Taylorbacteria bacterium]|nr:antitoxin [Candidatus Taylorbacteria bacterium]